MTNIGPQRKNVNNTVDLVNTSLEVSNIEDYPTFSEISSEKSIEQELEETRSLQQKARDYRKNELYESEDEPLKTGPMRIIRFQIRALEEELSKHQLELREQRRIEKIDK